MNDINQIALDGLVNQAAMDWKDAKELEAKAKAARLKAEERLCALIPLTKKEGSNKYKSSAFEITLTTKLDRKLDAEKVANLDKEIPAPILRRLIDYKPELNLSELRFIEENEPEYYRAFSVALTIKPAKTSVKVESI